MKPWAQIARHCFGNLGILILAATVTVACLKTAVGLVTSCGETFVRMFPRGPRYPVWAVGFCVISFVIANLGLNAILAWSTPVLMFLYPLAIVLILLTLCGGAVWPQHQGDGLVGGIHGAGGRCWTFSLPCPGGYGRRCRWSRC